MEVKDFFVGLKVVEFASVLAGPAVGMFFAEMGASVIKIESPEGDLTRRWKQRGENPSAKTSAYFHSVNWNKKSLFIDLLMDEGKRIALKHISEADILVMNFKPGDDKKLGFESKEIAKKYPWLIIAEVRGFDDSDRVAYDAVLQAETGLMSINGTPESGPVKLPIAFIDLFAAHQLKEAILIAMLNKSKTGKGALVKTSLYKSAIASLANQASNWLNNSQVPQRSGSLHPNIAPYGETFTTMDDYQVVLAVGTDEQFFRLCRLLGKEDLTEDSQFKTNASRVKNRDLLFERLKECFLRFTCDQLMDHFEKNNIPAGRLNSIDKVMENNIARSMILDQTEEDNSISKRVKTIAFDIEFL